MRSRFVVVLVLTWVALSAGAAAAVAAPGARPLQHLTAPHAVPAAQPPAPLPPAAEADWTVLVYMDGDNNLERWVAHDIDEELAAVGSNADVQVVVLADRGRGYSTADGDWTGTLAFNVTKGMRATPENAVADWGERDMGSPQTLTDFVTWARASYPSRHTALFFWDHGWGWWPGYTMHDVTSNDTLDMDEIRRSTGVRARSGHGRHGHLPRADDRGGGHVARLRRRAGRERGLHRVHGHRLRPVLRSAGGRPRHGRPPRSRRSRRRRTAAGTTAGRWRARRSCSDWRWDRLTAQVNALGWKLLDGVPRHRAEYAAARRHMATAYWGDPTSVDLYDAAYQLAHYVSSPSIRGMCRNVMRSVRAAVLYEWSTRAEGRQHGMAIYWPAAPTAAASRRGLRPLGRLLLLRGAAGVQSHDLLGGLPRRPGGGSRPAWPGLPTRRYACRTVNGRSAFARGRPTSAPGRRMTSDMSGKTVVITGAAGRRRRRDRAAVRRGRRDAGARRPQRRGAPRTCVAGSLPSPRSTA